uniref:Uncharacterized protein n=1 Tax=Arundo donax TaxID=35708 RepID=A0A0A9DJB5_ARUDO
MYLLCAYLLISYNHFLKFITFLLQLINLSFQSCRVFGLLVIEKNLGFQERLRVQTVVDTRTNRSSKSG